MHKVPMLKIPALVAALAALSPVSAATPWDDETVSQVNRLPARTPVVPCDAGGTPYVLSLDGVWDFTWRNGAEERRARIAVPGCWQLQGDFDPPLYTNYEYPFAYDPPHVEREPPTWWTAHRFRNPHGIYRRTFAVPSSWSDRKVTLRLHGYSSAVIVRLDGEELGYGEDGRLPNEWELPSGRLAGEGARPTHELEIEVLKFSDASYLEDQDMWRLSGLFRSVELIGEKPDGLRDFSVETRVEGADGLIGVHAVGAAATWRVFDAEGREVCRGEGRDVRTIPNVRLWSPRAPSLYRVRVEAGGDVFERKVGFRAVTIEDAVLKLNGERLVIRGVDRHESSVTNGYAVTEAEMRDDLRLMKAYGINAVRTSHYPNALRWYDLCDELGVLVVSEANVECHGSGHPFRSDTLSHRPSWRDAIVLRNENHVRVLKDHPSIIVWSLGNENGTGSNMLAAYEAVKALDPTRPVQYEGVLNPYWENRFDAPGTDIICPMYVHPENIAKALERGVKRPYILCEYAFAKGNANGDFKAYMELVDRYPSFQGGFIWDFADKALLGRNGRLAYGGDFGDQPNNGNDHCDGLFDAFRRPHPGAFEVARGYLGGDNEEMAAFKRRAHRSPPAAAPVDLDAVVRSLRLNFDRAPTDCDRGWDMPGVCKIWREATETGESFGFNVWPWRQEDLARARHREELPAPDGWLTVNIDAAISGVGGDDGWGARPHAAYRLEGAHTYRLRIGLGRR